MAIPRSTVKPTAKVQAKSAEVPTGMKKEEKPAEVKKIETKAGETKKLETKEKNEPEMTVEKAPEAKKESTVKKTAVKKETVKKPAVKKTTAKKAEPVKASVHIQFEGKSYETEDLVKIAKDIWKYDLKKKAGDFKTVDIYVKPEENMAYYVINNEVEGSFLL